jgi:TonB-dependent receptor
LKFSVSYLLLIICVLFTGYINAATIKGSVSGSDDLSAIYDARVTLKNTTFNTVTDTKGNFILQNIPVGDYTLVIQTMSYQAYEKSISIKADNPAEVINLKISLNPVIGKEMGTVTVTGVAGKETEAAARSREKNADNIVSVLSAQAIEKSPDITVANALQRVSGVSLQGNQNGVYAIIRGMNKRYNNTLINGLKITTPDPKARFVPLDIIPSDLLQKIEVIKSLTPDMEGDAIGGTVNIVMKEAPDSFLLNAHASIGYSDLGFKQRFESFNNGNQSKSPNELHGNQYVANISDFTTNNLKFKDSRFPPGFISGVSFGKRFLSNKFGFISSLSYQNQYRASNGVFYNIAVDPTSNLASPIISNQRNYSINSSRLGFNNKFDYRFDGNNKLVLTAILLKSDEYQYRRSIDTALNDNRTVPGTGVITYKERSRYREQLLGNFALQGYHDFANKLFSFVWTGFYSSASGSMPDQAEVATNFTKSHTPLKDSTSPITLDHIQHIWQKNTDKDISGMWDVYFRPKILGQAFEFKGGGLYREKVRNNSQTEYTISEKLFGGGKAKQIYYGIDGTPINTVVDNGLTAAYNVNNYTAVENILANYIQGKTSFGNLDILGGVRIESTYQHYSTQAGPAVGANYATRQYNDVLPGLHLKYALTPDQNIRFSVNKSISRPDFYEMVPYHIAGEYYDEYGNPYLSRTQATNFDLRYEYFSSKFNHFGLGGFYKTITNPIEYVLYLNKDQINTTKEIINPSIPLIIPQTLGTATLKGFELTGIYFIRNFGVSANYTFTLSQVTTSKYYYVTNRDKKGNDSIRELTKNETRPLQGQSKHIGNLSFIYRDVKIGFHAQLSFVFTGSRLENLSPFYAQDYYTKDYYTLDFSAEQKLNKHFLIFTKITNILNTPYQLQTKGGVLAEKDYYGRFLQLGLKYRFN